MLKSSEFDELIEASEVREKGIALVARLNGALNVVHSAQPLRLAGVTQVDGTGAKHTTIFGEAAILEMRVDVMEATITTYGPDGQPLPPSPPQPSKVQLWNQAALNNDNVADLLEQVARADNWYDIYKSVEILQAMSGGERNLKQRLGSSGGDFKKMRTTANYYRHARAPYPPHPLTNLQAAFSLLRFAARKVLEDAEGPEAKSVG